MPWCLVGVELTLVLFRPRWDEVRETFESLMGIRNEFDRLRLLVSGPKEHHGIAKQLLVETGLEDLSTIYCRHDNLGFAGGHNLLLNAAFSAGAEWCIVINPDLRIDDGALHELLRVADSLGSPKLVGPVLESEWSGRRVVDSAGIYWTRDSRHFDRLQGTSRRQVSGALIDVDGVTGACLVVSSEVHRCLVSRCGYFFDDRFLAYREDAELGVRCAAIGIGSTVVDVSGFFHNRHVRGSTRGRSLPDLLGVRNRFLMRWGLGRARPGGRVPGTLRDVVVILGVLVIERRSFGGVMEAWRIRRTMRYSNRLWLEREDR